MSPSYLLIVSDGGADWDAMLPRLEDRTGRGLAYRSARVAALSGGSFSCLPVEKSGCVIGTLFRRHGGARPLASFAPDELESIAGEGDAVLLRSFWGGYVSALERAGCVTVTRDPSATIPCYYSVADRIAAFASDADTLVRSGLATALIDFEEIARQFYNAGVPAPATALRGVRELLAGFEMRISGKSEEQRPCWSPWDWAEPGDDELGPAAERLSRTVAHCVQGWAYGRGRLLVSLSGGLDSSIVAASLARFKSDAVCLTMFADDPSGDERAFARALCQRHGLPLLERRYRVEDVDITEPLGVHLPRPKDRTQALAYERAHLEVAAEVGASAFMTGNGGDSIFGYSQSAAPIADQWLHDGAGPGLVWALRDVCRQTGCSMFDALAAAWRLARANPAYRCRPNPLFLHPDAVLLAERAAPRHPWLDAPAGALPGKAAHIAWILRVQQSLEPSRGAFLPVLNPLMSQPVLELCLSVPSWRWRDGGRDRALARRAFERDVPSVILNRRLKGSPGQFAARILEAHRASIRARLLDGHLARHGLLDVGTIDAALAGERLIPDEERVRILEITAAEAWLDHWLVRARCSGMDRARVTTGGRCRPHS